MAMMCLSYEDLFRTANRREMTEQEKRRFAGLPQSEKNRIVRTLVQQTAGAFECEDRRGADGVIYTAFCLTDKPKTESQELATKCPMIVNGLTGRTNNVRIQQGQEQMVVVDFDNNVSAHIHLSSSNQVTRAHLKRTRMSHEIRYQLTSYEAAMVLHYYVEQQSRT